MRDRMSSWGLPIAFPTAYLGCWCLSTFFQPSVKYVLGRIWNLQKTNLWFKK